MDRHASTRPHGDPGGIALHELRIDHPRAGRSLRDDRLSRRPSNAAERVAAWRSMRRRHRWDWLAQLFGLRDAA